MEDGTYRTIASGDDQPVPQFLGLFPYNDNDLSAEIRAIRKTYAIIAIQAFLTIVILVSVVLTHDPIPHRFFTSTGLGALVYVTLVFLPYIITFPLYICVIKYFDFNSYYILGFFNFSLSFPVIIGCAITGVEVLLETTIIIAVMLLSFIFYTFWGYSRGYGSWLPLLNGIAHALIVFTIIQIYFPRGGVWILLVGGLLGTLSVARIPGYVKAYNATIQELISPASLV